MKVLTRDSTDFSQEQLTFKLVSSQVDDFEQMSYTTFGLRVLDENGANRFECLDISTSREFVEGFIQKVQGRDVAAVHIGDLLEDYLE